MMENTDSECPISKDLQTDQMATKLASEFLEKYVDLALPGDESEANSKK